MSDVDTREAIASHTGTGVGWASHLEAEHAFADMAGAWAADPVSACTHVAAATHADATSTVVLTVEVAGGGVQVRRGVDPDDAASDAMQLLAERHAGRRAGRAFVFGGHDRLHGVMTVGELLAVSAVGEVVMIGSREPVSPDVVIDTQSFVRPSYEAGVLRLVVRPAPGGTVVPFEQPDPTPCCTDH